MSFQRSKSAPHSIASIPTLRILRSSSHENVQQPIRRIVTDTSPPPLSSPPFRVERDDPFSLANFFPTSRISEEEEGWHWLRAEGPDDVIEEDDDMNSFPSITASDEDAIKSEDKLGVLSLNTLFAHGGSFPTNDRLYTPYSDEDVVDVDQLYLALRARRGNDTKTTVSPFGELFLPRTETVEDTNSLKGFLDGFRKFLH